MLALLDLVDDRHGEISATDGRGAIVIELSYLAAEPVPSEGFTRRIGTEQLGGGDEGSVH